MSRFLAFTLNPSIDISTAVNRVLPGRKLRCEQHQVFPGGGGVNVARMAARLGADVELIYPAGGATGQLLRRLVDKEAIPNIAIPVAQETREDFTVLEEATGKEFRFVLPGPRLSQDEWRACLSTITNLQTKPSYIVASGSLPPGVPSGFLAQIARFAKSVPCRFVVDSSGEALAAALAEGVYLVKPNLRELKELTGEIGENPETLVLAARTWIAEGRTQVVALSLGEHGGILVTRDQAWFADAPSVKSVSTVGAGDSFLGALLWGLEAGLTTPEAFRYGIAAGAAAVLTPGTALAQRPDIERLLPDVRIRQVGRHGAGWRETTQRPKVT
ncbi:MAG: 1-phosphofructokinase family hexose kinase [Bradyrhizobiaceae bacterium]|nr:1-phosphofructokinase family hexose kinase [Bradyrhizobiaceae bacterium]